MLKLVVFDWNGTLFADVDASLEVTNRLLNSHGKKSLSLKKYRETITLPISDFYLQHGYEKSHLAEKGEEMQNFYHKHYEARASKCLARPGAQKLLLWLESKGLKTVILSNHTVKGINLRLKLLCLDGLVSEVLANPDIHTVFKRKNKLEKLRDYMRLHKYAENEVMIVGDSPEEVEVGKSLGIKSVVITDGFFSLKRLKESSPDFMIRNLARLKEVIESNGFLASKKRV